MGGFGSGRHSNMPDTDDCIRIELPVLRRLGMLRRGWSHRRTLTWACDGRTTAELTVVTDIECHERYPCLKMTGHAFGRQIDHLVMLDSEPQRFGGERWFALCPFTGGKRCTTLVLPPGKQHFASVKGWGVPYASQNEDAIGRSHRAIGKATSRLQGLSKYARKPTRERLIDRIVDREEVIDMEFERLSERIRWAEHRAQT